VQTRLPRELRRAHDYDRFLRNGIMKYFWHGRINQANEACTVMYRRTSAIIADFSRRPITGRVRHLRRNRRTCLPRVCIRVFYALIVWSPTRDPVVARERARDPRRGKTLMRMQSIPIIGYESLTRTDQFSTCHRCARLRRICLSHTYIAHADRSCAAV